MSTARSITAYHHNPARSYFTRYKQQIKFFLQQTRPLIYPRCSFQRT